MISVRFGSSATQPEEDQGTPERKWVFVEEGFPLSVSFPTPGTSGILGVLWLLLCLCCHISLGSRVQGERTGCVPWPSPDTPPEVARTHCGWHRGWPRGWPRVCSRPGALCAAGITCCTWGWPRDLWGHLSSPSPLGTQTTGCPQGSQPSPGVEPKAGHFLFLMLSWFLLNQVNDVGH